MSTKPVSIARSSDAEPPPRRRVEVILAELERLPALSAVAVELLSLTTSEVSSARDVVRVIESDASLTATVLRMARRCDLGISGRVTPVDRVVTLLGFKAVRNAALSVHLYETLGALEGEGGAESLRKGFWKHSLAVACAAEALAEQGRHRASSGQAFVCGLLHDLGKAALDACLPKSYARVVEQVDRRHQCICDVERETFGLDHTVAGRRVAERWQLPRALVDCIWLHHQPPDALPSSVANPELVQLVFAADNLVRRQRIGYSGYYHITDPEESAGLLGVDPKALEGIAAEIPARMEPYLELVGLDESTERTLHAESLVKANRELGRLNAELTESNRSLEVRGVCFEALNCLTGMLTPQDRVTDVCVAAAQAVREMVGGAPAIAFACAPSTAIVEVGLGGVSSSGSRAVVLELGETEANELFALCGSGAPADGMVNAPPTCGELWGRSAGASPTAAIWMLPFAGAEGTRGAVLLMAEEESIARFRSAPEACAALATGIALAIATARARGEAERTSEELLDLNRRFQAAQKELVRARSVSMVSEMAAGAAHEINNPLAVISGRAQMAIPDCSNDDLAKALTIIVEQAHTASQIVTDLMHFAKPPAPKSVRQSVRTVLEKLCQHWCASSSLRSDQVTLELADPEVMVCADPEQLSTILEAVLANAVEACRTETARLQINSPSRVSDETVRIVIEDNGVGMSRDVLEHAVDPFFSSRPAGRGRGIGLSRAYRLAQINGGHLWLESTQDKGTIVTIELPATASAS